MSTDLLENAKALPHSERLELFDALWETLRDEAYEPSLSPAQNRELDHRLAAHRKHPDDVVSWEEIKAEAEAGIRRS